MMAVPGLTRLGICAKALTDNVEDAVPHLALLFAGLVTVDLVTGGVGGKFLGRSVGLANMST